MALMKFLVKTDATPGPVGAWTVSDPAFPLGPPCGLALARCAGSWLPGSLPEDALAFAARSSASASHGHSSRPQPAALKAKSKKMRRCTVLRFLREVQQELSQAGSRSWFAFRSSVWKRVLTQQRSLGLPLSTEF